MQISLGNVYNNTKAEIMKWIISVLLVTTLAIIMAACNLKNAKIKMHLKMIKLL